MQTDHNEEVDIQRQINRLEMILHSNLLSCKEHLRTLPMDTNDVRQKISDLWIYIEDWCERKKGINALS